MSMFRFALSFVLIGVVASGFGASQAQGQEPPAAESDPYLAILNEQAITPELRGIASYLNGLRPSDSNHKLIEKLISQLGHEDFAQRELAVRQLIALPIVPTELLRQASDQGDSETRLRAQQIVSARAGGNASSNVAVACFRIITKKKLLGAAATLLDVLPLYGEEMVLSAGREALKATSQTQDAALLRRAARAGALEARIAAIGVLPSVMGSQSQVELSVLMTDPEPRIKLAAARALADQGDRSCLATLVSLLASPEPRVRQGSVATLRGLTGHQSEYAAWLEPHDQPDAIREWEKWLAKDGATAALNYPLRPWGYEIGRTLICLYAKNEIIELDANGRETFSVTESGGCPWACQGLSSGGRLVALYSSNCLVEYRADGKERIRIAVPGGPMSVQRLDNGNTLVACNNAQKVVEVDDAGKIVWELSLPGGPSDAVRLENGHTLVTLQNTNSIVEVDSAGKEIWKVDGLHTPRSASRLDNGNTLVCDLGSGRIVEYDLAGNEAWAQGGFSSPFGAQRLSNGATLVSDTQAVKEIDRDGKILSENKQPSLGRVHRF